MAEPVLFEIDERGVATITLNRPERLNAINMAMRDLLWEYLEACRDNPDVRAIVFRGEGRAFSAGADISEFGTAPSLWASRRARHERDVWGLMLSLPMPLVARMHGFCFGAGLELPLCCDVRVAAEDTQFGLPEVTLGYIPSAGGTQTLPRTIPPGAAADLILTGEPVGTEEALRWGLVTKVAPAAELDAAVEAAVVELLAGSFAPRRPRL
ncbi:MAG: enoyl-CoA hydratase/isomerase family protein [Dehalococcoidia bacterium]|nr:enoyl-CoA hydratase/isomerase family protein [Dehalococcoidia bacterium]MYA54527.1 enoyl-CoA hydratase/isomerase family protein [Dehalococcoidia bacterium]